MNVRQWCSSGLIAGAVVCAPVETEALSYNFERITANAATDVAGQFKLTLTSSLANQVLFKVENEGPLPSVITTLYFDDAAAQEAVLGNVDHFTGIGNVSFSLGASPANVPAGNTINFESSIAASARNPKPKFGVGPGEALEIYVNLPASVTFDDVVRAMNESDLRFAMHVQGLENGESDSFVNRVAYVSPTEPPVRTPEGGTTLMLLGLSIAGLHLVRKRLE